MSQRTAGVSPQGMPGRPARDSAGSSGSRGCARAPTAMRGKRPELVDAAVRSALRETVFRFELILRINVTAHELLDREVLIDAALGPRQRW